MTRAVGSSSCSNFSRFGMTSQFSWMTPVMLPPWPAKARHETELDWIGTHFEDDRNGEKNAFRDAKAIAEAALRPTQRANNRPSPEAWR
jgi:hypothetical protein